MTEVNQAAREYEVTGQIVAADPDRDPSLLGDRSATTGSRSSRGGRPTWSPISQAQRIYNDNVKAYHDTVVRHRRSMLVLNTALGQRVLP